MKRLIVLLIIGLSMFGPLCAQMVDKEMQRLIDIVASLRLTDRQQQKAAWNKAAAALGSDKAWTPMDEIVPDVSNECRLTDRTMHWFSINRLLSQQAGYEDTKVRGEFNNGEDPNFNYSLIERSVKAKATVNYSLQSREGRQLFVIMPFDTSQNALEAELLRKGQRLAQGKQKQDGNIYIDIQTPVQKSDVLTLRVKNKGKSNQAFVIINHNTRSK